MESSYLDQTGLFWTWSELRQIEKVLGIKEFVVSWNCAETVRRGARLLCKKSRTEGNSATIKEPYYKATDWWCWRTNLFIQESVTHSWNIVYNVLKHFFKLTLKLKLQLVVQSISFHILQFFPRQSFCDVCPLSFSGGLQPALWKSCVEFRILQDWQDALYCMQARWTEISRGTLREQYSGTVRWWDFLYFVKT